MRRRAEKKSRPTSGRAGDSFLEFVLEQLDGVEELMGRRMFGGYGLYAGETFFAILASGRLYLWTNEELRAHHQAWGMGPFQPSERQTLSSYYEVPLDILEDHRELTAWANRAIHARRQA